jgi:hypothetical protein
MFRRGWFRGLSDGSIQVRMDFLLYLSKENAPATFELEDLKNFLH